jgi:hypothetical protein
MLAADIETCVGSATCIIRTTFGVGLPTLLLLFVAARAAGVRVPGSVVLAEFICKYCGPILEPIS